MARRAEIRAVLSLDNSQFVRNIKNAMRWARDLARQFKAAPISTTFLAGMLTARQAIKGTAAVVQGFGNKIKEVFQSKWVKIGTVAIAGAMVYVAKEAVDAAAELERYTVIFGNLLGGMDKGAQRMKTLLTFANDNGLRLTTVAEASKTLEVFTRGALSGSKGLKLVGDVARGTNSEFEYTAELIGRTYEGLRSGTSVARELYQFRRSGAINGQQANRIEGLASVQQGAQGWKELQGALQRYDGMLQKLSFTWIARMEKFRDSIEEALRQFGTPLMEGLKPFLEIMTKAIFAMAPKFHEMGQNFTKGITTGLNFFVSVFNNPSNLVEPFIFTLKAGIYSVANVLYAAFMATVKTVFSGQFFDSLAQGFMGLSNIIAGQLMVAFQKPIAYFLASIEFGIGLMGATKAGAQDWYRQGVSEVLRKANGLPEGTHEGLAEGQTSKNGAITRLTSRQMMDNGISTAAAKPKSFDDFYNKWINGGMAISSKSMIKEGEAATGKAGKGVAGHLSSNFEIKDIFGAGRELKKAAEAIKLGAKQGEQILTATARSIEANSVRAAQWRVTGGIQGFRSALTTGHLSGASGFSQLALGGGGRQGSLLRFRERTALENERVAGLQAAGRRNARRGSNASPGGYNRVRRGDRARMQEVQRERLREKAGVDKTNQILEAIQKRFDELVK
jgi:hypothetical protein